MKDTIIISISFEMRAKMNNLKETDNPYTLRFSFIPPRMIERTVIIEEVISNFIRKMPTYSSMFITGVRGCGKTVILSDIRKRIDMSDKWITVDLNPENICSIHSQEAFT